jgi:hypothetical protein
MQFNRHAIDVLVASAWLNNQHSYDKSVILSIGAHINYTLTAIWVTSRELCRSLAYTAVLVCRWFVQCQREEAERRLTREYAGVCALLMRPSSTPRQFALTVQTIRSNGYGLDN